MTSPAAVPDTARPGAAISLDGRWHAEFRSMASPVRVQFGADCVDPATRFAQIRTLFAEVERQCTRFTADSDLMRANAAGRRWHPVGLHCFAALRAAARAHLMTSGRFDPRVLTTLVELGYDRTWAAVDRTGGGPADARSSPVPTEPWRPAFDHAGGRVAVGERPIDLGGIGKGLALRWAAAELRAAGCSVFLIEAGGDCVFGAGPEAGQWRIGVEDPADGADPVAVVEVADGACATSSTRLRAWRAGGRPVHHLIDPRTGEPGGGRLRSVTVVGADPADAEVWSKALFLEEGRIGGAAEEHGLAALWVDADGRIGSSSRMAPLIIWRRP